jgi:small redox-active disulfide protein 2
MKIEICGPGCAKCHATTENVRKAMEELGIDKAMELTEVKDIMAISRKGVLLTPAVIINGVKVSEGRVPKPEEIKRWIKERK